MILEDFNGPVGNNDNGIENILGKEGEETKINNRERINEICLENDLMINKTKILRKTSLSLHKLWIAKMKNQ